MINPAKLLKLKKSWETFTYNHPKFPMFLKAVQRKGLEDGTVMEINITSPQGDKMTTNIKLNSIDIDLIKEITNIVN